MKRRDFFKKTLGGAAGISLLTSFYAWQVEPFWLEFVSIPMSIPNLPAHFIGKKIMQISDIHLGKKMDYNFIIRSFQKAQKFNPDIVVYTGDFVNTHDECIDFDLLKNVLDHCVKGTLGTYAILGNHDYGYDWSQPQIADRIVKHLNQVNIITLRNQKIELNGLHIIGIDDLWSPNFDPDLALKDMNSKQANIVLCHNPDVCDLDIWKDYNSWILSGHTHGGQCKPPFLPPPILPVQNKRYTAGKIALSNQRTLYINRALGFLWQVRFNVRPEITIFDLN